MNQSSIAACPAGYYCPDGASVLPCAGGTYSVTGSASCTKCDSGYVSAPNATACSSVVPGYEWVNSTIRACNPGSYSSGGTTLCQPCAAGYYQSTSAASFCIVCPPGYKCPANNGNGGGATSAIQCVGGTVPSSDSLSCAPCDDGYYSPAGSSTCLSCPIGSYCPQVKNLLTGAVLTGAVAPTVCEKGTYTAQSSSRSCLPCQQGSYCDQGIIKLCSPQYYSLPSASTCIQCPSGTYQEAGGQSLCNSCPSGYFCVGGSKYPCESGQYSRANSTYCEACKPGWDCSGWKTGLGIFPCDAGLYNNGSSLQCLPCEKGFYQSRPGSSYCFICPQGSSCPLPLSGGGASSFILCEAGFYSLPGSVECSPCAAGYVSFGNSPSCAPCDAGYFCNSTSSQTQCKAGSFCPIGSSEERMCEGGYYCENTSTKKKCKDGSYCPPMSVMEGVCPMSYYCNTPAEKDVCPTGYFCPGDGSKYQCSPGSACSGGTSEPILCDVGTFATFDGSSSCEVCPGGTYSDKKGSSSCLFCPVGYKCSEGSSSPSPCARGSICKAGSSIETTCKSGHYCPPQLNDYVPCPMGTWTNRTDLSEEGLCTQCGAFLTTINPGSVDASNCTCQMSYFYDEDIKECTKCPVGLDCARAGVTSDSLTTQEGYYYNANEVTKTSKAYAIVCSPLEACKNTTNGNETVCSTELGYEQSVLCSKCQYPAFYRSGSAQSSTGKCLPCSENSSTYNVVLLIMVLLGSSYVTFVSLRRLQSNERKNTTSSRQSNDDTKSSDGTLGGVLDKQKLSSVALRAALSHFQILGFIGRFDFKWPPIIASLFSVSDLIGSASIGTSLGFSIDVFDAAPKCRLRFVDDLLLPHNELLVSFFFLAVIAIVSSAFMVVIRFRSQYPLRAIAVTLITLCYMMYSNLLRSFFQLFSCTTLGGNFNIPKLNGALNHLCSLTLDPTYALYTAAIGIPAGLFLLCLPVLSFLTLRSADRTSDYTSHVYGFLFNGYKKDLWYWEWIVVGRKILLSMIVVFMAGNANLADDDARNVASYKQGLLACFIMFSSLLLQISGKPYEDDWMNSVDIFGLLVSNLSIYLGLVTYSDLGALSQILLTIIVVTFNVVWAIFTLTILSTSVKEKVARLAPALGRHFSKRKMTDTSSRFQLVDIAENAQHASSPPAVTNVYNTSTHGDSVRRSREFMNPWVEMSLLTPPKKTRV